MCADIKTFRRVSSVDVAKAAGVSQATVSYVFNGRKGATVPDNTREHVLNVAKTLGYRPNKTAQSLKTGQTHVIAFWNDLLHTQLSAQVLGWVRQIVEADGYEIIISGTFKGGSVSHWPVDGILAFDSLYHILDVMQQEPLYRIPLVSMGPFHVEGVDYVGVDLYSGARQAVEHLVAVASRSTKTPRIAYMVEENANGPGEQRHEAYAYVMQQAGLPLEYILTKGETRTVAREQIKHYLELHGTPDAVFCENDEMAIGLQRGLHDLGVSVPEDVMVMGCDGIEETGYHNPAISTISQPLEEMCALGWRFLRNRLEDRSLSLQQATLQSHPEFRASTSR